MKHFNYTNFFNVLSSCCMLVLLTANVHMFCFICLFSLKNVSDNRIFGNVFIRKKLKYQMYQNKTKKKLSENLLQ